MSVRKGLRIFIALAFQVNVSSNKIPEYDYDEYNEVSSEHYEYDEDAVTFVPEFLSRSTNIDVDEGDAFRLPCFVKKMDDFVLMWMKNEKIISLGNQILINEGARYSLETSELGNNLIVYDATNEDGGTYYCRLSSYDLASIHHVVTIRMQPVIEIVPKGPIVLMEGDDLNLFCYLHSGVPKPEVYWLIRNDENDTEHLEQELRFTDVVRQHTGQYVCLADNGFGLKPVSQEVSIIVQYPPEVEIRQVYLQSAHGSHIYICCTVQSALRATVTWMKDGLEFDAISSSFSTFEDGEKYILLLETITSDSFGDYSCKAENAAGIAEQRTHLSHMGCWATHDVEYFGDKDLKLQEKMINQKDLQYGLMCTRPFVEENQNTQKIHMQQKKSQQVHTAEESQTRYSQRNNDQGYKEELQNKATFKVENSSAEVKVVMDAQLSEVDIGHPVMGTKDNVNRNKENNIYKHNNAQRLNVEKDKTLSSTVYSHEEIKGDEKVELYVLDADNIKSSDDINSEIGSYPEYVNKANIKNSKGLILSTESRTETVDVILPNNDEKLSVDTESHIRHGAKKDSEPADNTRGLNMDILNNTSIEENEKVIGEDSLTETTKVVKQTSIEEGQLLSDYEKNFNDAMENSSFIDISDRNKEGEPKHKSLYEPKGKSEQDADDHVAVQTLMKLTKEDIEEGFNEVKEEGNGFLKTSNLEDVHNSLLITSDVDNNSQEVKEEDIRIDNTRAKDNNSEHKFNEGMESYVNVNHKTIESEPKNQLLEESKESSGPDANNHVAIQTLMKLSEKDIEEEDDEILKTYHAKKVQNSMVINSDVDNDLQEIKEEDLQIEDTRAKDKNSEHKFNEKRKNLIDQMFQYDLNSLYNSTPRKEDEEEGHKDSHKKKERHQKYPIGENINSEIHKESKEFMQIIDVKQNERKPELVEQRNQQKEPKEGIEDQANEKEGRKRKPKLIKEKNQPKIPYSTKPNITYSISRAISKEKEATRSISELVEEYRTVKFDDCQLQSNTAIENENTIKMTIRESPKDCHFDCQVTKGCLGWFFGDVGGLNSCVLYGCGEFKIINQPNSVSCQIGNCIDGWLDELHSCKYKDFYISVGEERFERIIQVHDNVQTLSADRLIILILTVLLLLCR